MLNIARCSSTCPFLLLCWRGAHSHKRADPPPLAAKGEAKAPLKVSADELHADWQQAPIQSYSDLYDHIRAMPENNSPLNQLSEGALAAFLDSVVITEKGLGSFNPPPLQAELSSKEITAVLSLFGAQRLAPLLTRTDMQSTQVVNTTNSKSDVQPSACTINNYKCEVPATCVSFFGAICIYCNCTTK